MDAAKDYIRKSLDLAGITLNGTNPWDIQIHNEQSYQRIITQQSLGLGESYMDGWWDCQRLDEFFNKLIRAKLDKKLLQDKKLLFTYLRFKWQDTQAKLFNLQNKHRAYIVGEQHYDIGNDLYQAMLDSKLNYTCGYWRNAQNLEQAQIEKLDLVCRKLMLKPGMKILDIGCGWGAFAKYAAEKYQVQVVGITISKNQAKFATQYCANLPVEIYLQDYRDLTGIYDRIVSLGMFEHVGYKNYHTYMKVANRCLSDDGLFLLHTIGSPQSETRGDDWINKYIFPNSMLPSLKQIAQASEHFLIIEDVHNFGADYDRTLMAWHNNFNKNWDKIKSNYDQRFFRMWNYYLLFCAGIFRSREAQLWQLVMAKPNPKSPYLSIR